MNKEIKEYALMLINNKAKNNRLSIIDFYPYINEEEEGNDE